MYLFYGFKLKDFTMHFHVVRFIFQSSEYPVVLIAIFVEKPMPFLEEMLKKVTNLDYPKDKIDLFVHNQVGN